MLQRNDLRRKPRSSGQGVGAPFSGPESRIDEALVESFPASDAPYWTLGIEAVSPGGESGLAGAARTAEDGSAGER